MRVKGWCFSIFVASFMLLSFIINGEEQFVFVYDSHGKKDPFAPPVLEEKGEFEEDFLLGIKLKAIIWDREKPLALINNKVVGIGDTIAGAKIVDIKENKVIFLSGKRKITVKLREKELEEYGI